MEPGRDWRAASSLSLGASLEEQPPGVQAQKGPEESLSENFGSQDSLSRKTVVITMNPVDWIAMNADDNPPSRKRRREKPVLYKGSSPGSSPQQKRKKKKSKVSNVELQDSLTPSLSSVPSSLDSSVSPGTTDSKIPPKESPNPAAKLTKPESTGDRGNQVKTSDLDTDQNLELLAKTHGGSTDVKARSEQDIKDGAAGQHFSTTAIVGKMEVESSKNDDTIGEQTSVSEEPNKVNCISSDQSLENTLNVQNLVGIVAPSVPEGCDDNISVDLHCNVESSENKGATLSAENQNQGMKRTMPESETSLTHKTSTEEVSKQQRNASVPKKTKLEEETKAERGREGLKDTATPVEESCGKGNCADLANQKQQQANQKQQQANEKKQQANQKKQQANQKAENQQTAQEIGADELSCAPFDDVITVYFHAILSRDFKFDPVLHKIFIRTGIAGKDKWTNFCELHCSKDLAEHGYLIEGCGMIPKNYLDQPIAYKYYIARGKQGEHEFIYKKGPKETIVNRCLIIQSQYLNGTDWHQYDDIVCAAPSESMWTTIKNNLPFWTKSENNTVKGKQIAARVMLDSLFSILNTWTLNNVKNFLFQFRHFYVVNIKPMIHEGGPKEWRELKFGEEQMKALILDYLKKIVHDSANCTVQNKLGLGLIILLLGQCYRLPTSETDLEQLCSILCLDKPPVDVMHEVYALQKVFSSITRMELHLMTFCDICIKRGIHQWLWTIPILHIFTSKELNNVQLHPPLQNEKKWAGLEDLPFIEYRDKKEHQQILLERMKEKKYLLERNRLLFRSWFSLLPLQNLVEFVHNSPADLLDCLPGTYYRLQGMRSLQSNCKEIEKLLEMVLSYSTGEQKFTLQQNNWTFLLHVCLSLYQMLCDKVQTIYRYKILVKSVQIVSSILGLEPEKVSEQNTSKVHQKLCEMIRNWIRRVLTRPLLNVSSSVTFTFSMELEAWDQFLKINFPDKNFTEEWKKILMAELESRIKQEIAIQRITAYCDCQEKFENLDPMIGKAFENCAIDAIDSAYQEKGNLLDLISTYDLNNLGQLVSAAITRQWPIDQTGKAMRDLEGVLHHLLVWPDIKHIFIFNGAGVNILDQLTDEAQELMAVADSIYTNVIEKLMAGNILVKHVELIVKHKTQFISIYELKCKQLSPQEKSDQRSELEKVLTLRLQEVLAVKREQNWLGSLLDMCRKVQDFVKVSIVEMEQKHRETLALKELNVVVKARSPVSDNTDKIETYYHLSPVLKEVSKHICNIKESHIFHYCWELTAKKLAEDADNLDSEEDIAILNLDEVPDFLFDPSYREFCRLYNCLKSGELTFAEVDALFKDFVNDYDEVKKDFQIMCGQHSHDGGEWIDERIHQIQQYHELHLALDSAEVIEAIKEVLNLSGDFKVLLHLLNFKRSSIQQEKLSSMSPELMHAKKLLQDVTESRRRCLEELALRKEFVSWVKEALEDINELKVFVDLASISAGENDMDVDRVACFHDAVLGYSSLLYELKRESGFEEFMNCLGKLWKALASDNNLPKKLRDSARYLEWLKTIKESHGSVELSSISLATTINAKGIYTIRAPTEGQKVLLHSVLCLTIPESHGGQEEVRRYSFEELQELMNKLMLMSGKVEQSAEVEKFSEVFSSVQRLALSFIDLYSAGNMLFQSWIADVNCSPKNELCIIMNFNLHPSCDLLGNGDITEVLPAICRKMESFLERWNLFVSEKRSQYFYLNFYTAEQIVYLCRDLGSKCPSEAALMMLSFIKHNCSKQDVHEVTKQMESKKSKRNFDFFEPMERKTAELTVELEHIWESYMKNMDSFFPGCLDIETLGIFLDKLASLEKRSITRVLPQGLHVSRPNLILCPRSDILASTLAIYMNSPEQTLPSYDEVLLCTPATTYEEVELFLRRCLTPGCKEKKVYSLLFADELSYDVGYRSEELFQRLHLKHQDDYSLVILCNCEREHCYVPSVFSQFRVHMIPQQPLRDVQSYLGNHYKATQSENSPASLFKDQMCIGVVSSKRAGMGKSLYVKRLHEKMRAKLHGFDVPLKTIRLIEPHVDESKVLKSLLPFLVEKYQKEPMMFHFDITSSVQMGIPEFLFKLLVLRYLADIDGKLWLRRQCHLYVIEILETTSSPKRSRATFPGLSYNLLDVFPKVTCRSPLKVLERDTQKDRSHDCSDPGMDQELFCSAAFQRPFQYLTRFFRADNLDTFQYEEDSVEGTPAECLQLLLIHCGVKDPSWSELRNFAWFLNLQLRNCERSVFCNRDFIHDALQGFKNFVVTFMILMAKDFATPSLNISDESPGRQVFNMEGVTEEDLAPFRIRRKWESEPHPYIFFNEDSTSMTFIGFHLKPNANGGIDAINPLNGSIIKNNVMSTQLYQGLVLQRVPFNVDFDRLPRDQKIATLCMVLGIQWPIDPDETYELTTDNILKILAIEMRFRCGIPVVLMGETGCGKTRLIKFLCELRRSGAPANNMKLVKVHGGTTADAIYDKVRDVEAIAIANMQQFQFGTILFFDEANTTEAVSSIKEVLCDHTVEGEPLKHNSGLQIIAACNPYRKHTEKMIERLESSGLGYHVKAEETKDKLGSIPLRQLVYRVHALPPSMMPLVWDFGQLNNSTEKLYIQQIVQRLNRSIPMSDDEIMTMTQVLFESQTYMRKRNDECSFISLRDVERCVEVFKWFYSRSELLMKHLEKYLAETKTAKGFSQRDPFIWSLVLSVSVCYHASLAKKEAYRRVISKILPSPYDNEKEILEEIGLVQDLFLNGAPLRETIARNLALKENVFMMVICIELKIPLFLIGKPGSSKSLAKTIVADAMQGQAAYSELYKELKQIHLVSFQCSPHSTPEGIINTFKHCSRFQEGKNLKEYVSVVVLDEIGLAEDSPKMPLKTLHPLLEDGCVDDDPLPHKKVGFIGISNWALDPAKMNRGIFVSRGDPSKKELIESAKGICASERVILQKVEHFFPIFADAYEEICKIQNKEFFGLRDYYSLIKMAFALTKRFKSTPGPRDLAEVVLRNFSGKEGIEALDIFMSKMAEKGNVHCENISTINLVKQNIYSDYQEGECRYLLVLTENYAALQILQQTFFREAQPEIIFGSSFPKDQEYTQICRNINRVKICMETGQMVVLLNLQNLYESLYDALNQYYVQLAGQKYVDLGLGTHRVKCRVHPEFRLIVIEEKEVVYKHFPIPLINRLEKHYLDINSVLEKWQRDIVKELKKWVDNFRAVNTEKHLMGQQKYTPSDVFVGYHSDTCASVVLQVTEELKTGISSQELIQKVEEQAKLVLLNCATPDSVIRLGDSCLGSILAHQLAALYFQQQQHACLADFLHACLDRESRNRTVFTEITTFSRLLTAADTETFQKEMCCDMDNLKVLFLHQFDTEHSFLKEIRTFLSATPGRKILIVQTDFENGPLSAQLVASAKYSAVNEINKIDLNDASVFVFFITKLSRVKGGSSYVGFHGGLWQSVHIDDLRRSKDIVSDVSALRNITISELFSEDKGKSVENHNSMMAEGLEEKEEEMEVEVIATPSQETLATNILDSTLLLKSCVQSAVGMLRDQNEIASRSTKRIEILLSLLSEEDDLKGSFLKITKKRLSDLLMKQEESVYTMKQWVLQEASNLNALQEAGTFRHTLWKRVQRAVTPLLAYMLSVLDRDCNLDLLVNPVIENCVKDLWMYIFSDLKLLNIPYVMGQRSSQKETVLVQNYSEFSSAVGNEMPFSWRIKDYLEDILIQAQHIENEDHAKKFVNIFQQTALGKYIATLSEEEQNTLFHCYSRDFILLTMGVTSYKELHLLRMALISCIEEIKPASSTAEDGVLPLPWIHLGYHQFRNRLQNFTRILAVYPDVFDALDKHAGTGGNISHPQMVLDVLSALACTEMLQEKLLNCSPEAWLQQVKNLQMPIELVCSVNYLHHNGGQCEQLLQEVRSQWNRVFSVSLFVEHVLLEAETSISGVQDLVKKYTVQLGKCFQWNSDIKSHKTFTAVMEVLRQCKEAVSLIFCRYGLKPCPICMGDPTEPVNLPCDHVYCHSCIKVWLVPERMQCPLCLTKVPEDYTPTVSKELSIAIGKNAQFRKCCNSFFIDLVSTMCFKDNEPPEKAVIQELLNLLFVHAKYLRGSAESDVHTKSLSPFDDVVDKTPVIRSMVLKLLLKYSFSDVKVYIKEYLSQVETSHLLDNEDKVELYVLFVNCFEDSICKKSGAFSEESKTNYLKDNGHFLKSYLKLGRSSQETSQEATIEYLQGVARIRQFMDMAAELLFELHGTAGSSEEIEKKHYLERVMQFCDQIQNDWCRVYLIRKLTDLCGMEFTQRLSSETQFQWIFPSEIIQQQQRQKLGQIDRFLVYGRNYRMLRDAMGKAMIESQTHNLAAALKICDGSKSGQAVHFLLAVFQELTSLYGCKDQSLQPKQEQCDILKEFIQNSRVLPSSEWEAFANYLVTNSLPSLSLSAQDSSHKRVVIEMAVHTAAVLLSGQNQLLVPLRNLAFSPNTMQNAFLPTMPEDLLAQAVKWEATVGLHWYTCPNGHPCAIGECGRPMQQGRCVDCGAAIGGENHRALPTFQKAHIGNDRTQTGHVLGDPGKRVVEVAPEREMPPAALILIRLLTHLALLLGATKNPQSLLQIIKPEVQDPVSFFLQHIRKDIEQLMNTLGKSADDTANVVHLILCRLLKEIQDQGPVYVDGQLSKREHRNNWERLVAQTVILPELKQLDKTLLELNQEISTDERLSSNPLVKLIYGDPATFLSRLPKNSIVHCSRMWSCRKSISVQYLSHIVQQKGGKEPVPILWKFLQKEAELRLVKFLPEILALQKDLVKRFQNISEVEYRTIEDFLNNLPSGGMKHLMMNRVKIFLNVWNKLRSSLETSGEIKLPKGYCDNDLTVQNEFEIILPRRQGLGLCSTALSSYLIALHNDFVTSIEKETPDANRPPRHRYSVSPTEVTDLHVIAYEVERDLIPLILSNCQYSLEKGGEAVQEFDLAKIQQQLIRRFLQGKPLITLKGMPTLMYRHDRNYEHLFSELKSKLSQSSLPNSTISTISGELQSYSDICEALSVTEITLGFLAMAGGDPEMTLTEYMENILQMGSQTSAHVLKALSRCQLKHTIALWQLIASHKSEQLLHLKRDPFAEVSASYKHKLTMESTKLLTAFLVQAGMESFLQELHEMILLKLKHPQEEFNPVWSLKDTFISYLEQKDSKMLEEIENMFPEEILLSQCIDAWKLAATLKRNRRLG
ncbi:E3 ubiquitin-protein ligase RNF213 isoform X2 [Varanus komodoensis]|uniref:E3 ubiquitin-protein ligase RNF213 isoform X2 n=1 Tax=Varanus komodoensis TaxID=61221 RepID=UPI001CF7A330|nr:E3 ubiquitin-protein ligase RNF213 isoform X2 [Varanus komodoensis]